MTEMHLIEKAVVNSRLYSFFYVRTFFSRFLGFCSLHGKVLELGCGNGVTSEMLAKRFTISLLSTDFDKGQLEKAEKRLTGKGITLVQADATQLSFKGRSFDFVVEANALHHIPDYEKALAEACRVLKTGGGFFLMDISRYFFWPLLHILPFDPFPAKFTKEQMIHALEKTGFEIVRHSGNQVFMIEARKRSPLA